MTTPNAELAYRVLDHIDAHPEQWRQDLYIGKAECGTVGCFAGLTCLLSGEMPDFAGLRGMATQILVSGTPVGDRAQQLLGTSRYLVDHTGDIEDERDLFDEWNDRDQLGRLVAEIFGPRPAATS